MRTQTDAKRGENIGRVQRMREDRRKGRGQCSRTTRELGAQEEKAQRRRYTVTDLGPGPSLAAAQRGHGFSQGTLSQQNTDSGSIQERRKSANETSN
jgi:hypothetical protein